MSAVYKSLPKITRFVIKVLKGEQSLIAAILYAKDQFSFLVFFY